MSNEFSPVEQLMAIKGEARGIAYDADRDRFNMPHSADTNISDSLNANRINILVEALLLPLSIHLLIK